MPRSARLDAPGILHHVMARGIERRDIFRSDVDRVDFLSRIERLVDADAFDVFAWALLDNHFHLLVRSGSWPLSRSLRSLLSGYATSFNRRHRRSGHLFQNRYKSIVCEDEPYFLELVRYIHLNPLRAGLVRNLAELDRFPWCGHSAILGRVARKWQSTDQVLSRFGRRQPMVEYRNFVREGAKLGSRPDLMGGGLVRSAGGWEAVSRLRRGREAFQGDERVLGSTQFVEEVRAKTESADPGRRVVGVETLAARIANEEGISIASLLGGSRVRSVARARANLCWVWVRHLGQSGRALARTLAVTPAAVYGAVRKRDGETPPSAEWLEAMCRAKNGRREKKGGEPGRDK